MSKIAYIGIKGLPSKGGAERVVEAIANRLKDKHKLTVYCSHRYTPDGAAIAGVKLIRIRCFAGKHIHSFSLFIYSAIHAILKGDYDLIHLHNAESCFVVPLLKTRYRVIATSHGPAYARDKWGKLAKFFLKLMDYFFMHFPDKLTSVSLDLAQGYEGRYGKEVRYLPNGVQNTLRVNLGAAAHVLEQNGVHGEYLLFAAGRMDRTKGCGCLLRAFRRIGGNIMLVIVGDAETDREYAEELKQLADSRVRFIPFISDTDELFGILSKSRVFVFPSTIEAMSMVLMEAASLGAPIVCSNIPANRAALSERAIYFRAGDPDDLYRKLSWAITHPEEMKEMGREARAWVTGKFSWDVIAREYDHLYGSLLQKS